MREHLATDLKFLTMNEITLDKAGDNAGIRKLGDMYGAVGGLEWRITGCIA